jgi:hypothetical protein
MISTKKYISRMNQPSYWIKMSFSGKICYFDSGVKDLRNGNGENRDRGKRGRGDWKTGRKKIERRTSNVQH